MNNLYKLYLDIINEWYNVGQQSLSNFPLSYKAGLYHFDINSGHSNNRDYERIITYTIGEITAYKILD